MEVIYSPKAIEDLNYWKNRARKSSKNIGARNYLFQLSTESITIPLAPFITVK
jgi:hypothetical protein